MSSETSLVCHIAWKWDLKQTQIIVTDGAGLVMLLNGE